MNRENFNNLSVIEQVKTFNKMLSKNSKITKTCNELGISYNTIRGRFINAGYTFNKYTKQYECIEKLFPLDEVMIEKTLENIVLQIFNKDKKVNPFNLSDDKSEVITRSFRVRKNTLEKFIKFCEERPFCQYDILSKFIDEGINSYI